MNAHCEDIILSVMSSYMEHHHYPFSVVVLLFNASLISCSLLIVEFQLRMDDIPKLLEEYKQLSSD